MSAAVRGGAAVKVAPPPAPCPARTAPRTAPRARRRRCSRGARSAGGRGGARYLGVPERGPETGRGPPELAPSDGCGQPPAALPAGAKPAWQPRARGNRSGPAGPPRAGHRTEPRGERALRQRGESLPRSPGGTNTHQATGPTDRRRDTVLQVLADAHHARRDRGTKERRGCLAPRYGNGGNGGRSEAAGPCAASLHRVSGPDRRLLRPGPRSPAPHPARLRVSGGPAPGAPPAPPPSRPLCACVRAVGAALPNGHSAPWRPPGPRRTPAGRRGPALCPGSSLRPPSAPAAESPPSGPGSVPPFRPGGGEPPLRPRVRAPPPPRRRSESPRSGPGSVPPFRRGGRQSGRTGRAGTREHSSARKGRVGCGGCRAGSPRAAARIRLGAPAPPPLPSSARPAASPGALGGQPTAPGCRRSFPSLCSPWAQNGP
ncbi:basic proline-rich protein-like [Vidua macroura]|uniref:basic proline-rich protein-like n=1 Tax=Vidua macroura TaxID=187451 RepID=UPI0023A7912D|nr:basic proline-rich protein-like [Vidua macroura]